MLAPVFTLPPNVAYTDAGNIFTLSQSIYSGAAISVPLVVRGAVSQSANLQQWQDSGGNSLARVDALGRFIGDGSLLTNLPTPSNVALKNAANTFTTGTQTINTGAVATVGLVVKGAALQTANLTEWQDSSGNVVGEYKPFGRLVVNQLTADNPDTDLAGSSTLFHFKQNNVTKFAAYSSGVLEAYNSIAFGNATTPCGLKYGGAGVLFNDGNGSVQVNTPSAATFSVNRTGNPSGSVVTMLQALKLNPTATPAAGMGGALEFQLKSSTTADQQAGRLTTQWVDATQATRKARTSLSAFDFSAEREGLRVEASGTAAMIGFLGAAAAARPVVSGSRGGNLALASLLTALATLGLITDSTTA